MFFFEQTFQTVLNGVSGALGPMGAITNIANAVLLLCALFAVYEAYARGGDARMIGITPAELKRVGNGILVSAGAEKLAAMKAALVGGYVKYLVTDEATGTRLLTMAKH